MVTVSSSGRKNNQPLSHLKDKVHSGSNKGSGCRHGCGCGNGRGHAKDTHIDDDGIHAAADMEVQVLKDNVVTEDSRTIYVNTNIHLMYFFFDDATYKHEMINCMFINAFENADSVDMENGTPRCSHSCKLRVAMRKALLGCRSIEKIPITIEKLSFTHFSRYLTYRKNLGTGNLYSRTYYEGMRTSINHVYRSCGMEMPSEFRSELSVIMGGLKMQVAREKQEKVFVLKKGSCLCHTQHIGSYVIFL